MSSQRGGGLIGRAALSCVLLLLLLVPAPPAFAAEPLKGVALVIGNAAYQHLPTLANPADDARAMEALFDRLGFRTEATTDRDLKRLRRDLEDFVDDAEGADVATIYYSGHGIEVPAAPTRSRPARR